MEKGVWLTLDEYDSLKSEHKKFINYKLNKVKQKYKLPLIRYNKLTNDKTSIIIKFIINPDHTGLQNYTFESAEVKNLGEEKTDNISNKIVEEINTKHDWRDVFRKYLKWGITK